MSPSQNAVELCALLVNETYGELASRIFTILLRRGRLPVSALSQHTRLTPRQLRHGLAVLVQQNLVYHNSDKDTGLTHYEANHDAAYALVRSGKIMEFVQDKYGPLARDVVHNLLLLGHTQISDLEEAYESKGKDKVNGSGSDRPAVNGMNGHAKSNAVSAGQLHTVLFRLFEAGLIERVIADMFRSPSDTYNQLEKDIMRDSYGGSAKGPKQKDELKSRIRDKLQDMRANGRDWKPNGKKRPLNGEHMNGATKRRRLSHGSGAVNGDPVHEDDGFRLDPNLVLRINYEKCTVILRNQQLVEMARIRIGKTTSQVYEELLSMLEAKIPRCRPDPMIDNPQAEDEVDGPSVSTIEVAAALSRSIRVGEGIGRASDDNTEPATSGQSQSSKKRRASEMEADTKGNLGKDEDASDKRSGVTENGKVPGADHDSDGHSDDPFADSPPSKAKRPKVTFQDKPPKSISADDKDNRMMQVKNHLMLLAGDDCHFIKKCGIRGLGEWCVDFESLVKKMQEIELDQLLLENFGELGHRLARMMRKLGKLDEKQLPNLALVKQRDMRTKLAEMQMAGVVDIQEVPKDSSRGNNARTLFLWYFDPDQVSMALLDRIYKSMSRMLQRLEIERRKAHTILELTERSDLRDQSPEDYLTGAQLNELQAIQRKEEQLLGQIGRLDQLVGVFRDY
ncbi:uncharacterized protein BP5553_02759 [Venustampulla echinocandica]|uniref:DNA-directed RNA polymerase III subunit RPC3 n=1 Tax=Venustampulla echinocandica TaxID=2656787 RepID=A0A370TSA6_9HELO|nr:uncharacterized protein BP5553_02759 [Venustampulla echinocandica]RDL38419.1 hypothetical protein BP5553_02759 [Venustampulla echinocandica]